jgi:hypothetical protein
VVEARQWDDVRTSFLARTAMQLELRNTVIWLYAQDDATDELIVQIRKSEKITGDINETTADKDVAQYARAERRLAERNRDAAVERLRRQVLEGIFVFRGKPTPVSELAITLDAAVATMLLKSAAKSSPQYALVKIQPKTNLAEQFLGVEHLGAMPADRDPLHLVAKQGGAPRVDVQHPALAETLRAFRDKVKENGGGSLLGSAVQDFFAEPPYGWSKDAVRYLLAALLVAGEIELRTGGETLKTAGPAAAAAMKSTVAFNKVVVALRGSRPNPELPPPRRAAADRALWPAGAAAGRAHQPGSAQADPRRGRAVRRAARPSAPARCGGRRARPAAAGPAYRAAARGCQRCGHAAGRAEQHAG